MPELSAASSRCCAYTEIQGVEAGTAEESQASYLRTEKEHLTSTDPIPSRINVGYMVSIGKVAEIRKRELPKVG